MFSGANLPLEGRPKLRSSFGWGKTIVSMISKQQIESARDLRANMTGDEKALWLELKKFRRLHGVHFRRQAPIGPYVVDFVTHSKRYVVELDGEFHAKSDQRLKDQRRDAFLHGKGYRVRHITTGAFIENSSGCIETIMQDLNLMENTHDH
ncbi:endonuclease domain-containing protein [Pseudahrensia aquimaris]|uniref:Endonuclease domain-containing protein n=1 Tax=Pseudahrensia aquimaris TaxID=744461 RepID=A0ABW3FBY6_9HYPH